MAVPNSLRQAKLIQKLVITVEKIYMILLAAWQEIISMKIIYMRIQKKRIKQMKSLASPVLTSLAHAPVTNP
jgi:uncharacterized membrane protein